MSIPLVQNNEKDSINTSIIAIKRQIERINMLLGLVDSGGSDPDLSGFVKKSDVVDIVEAGNMNPVTSNAVVPVDEVTLGNMQSVSSNAVAEATGYLIWENPDSTQSFGAQTLNYDRPIPTGFSRIKIEVRNLTTENIFYNQEFYLGKNSYFTVPYGFTSGNLGIMMRNISNITNNSFDIEECRYVNSQSGLQTTPNRLVPNRIWALK